MLTMSLLQHQTWPHKIIHDTAYLFIPFSLVVLLMLLGGALLITAGRLSHGVLVGFCVTAGILIGLLVICHLARYCAWARRNTRDVEAREGTSSSGSESLTPLGIPVRVQSPRSCARRIDGLPTLEVAAPQTGDRNIQQVIHNFSDSPFFTTPPPPAYQFRRGGECKKIKSNTKTSCRSWSKKHLTKASPSHSLGR